MGVGIEGFLCDLSVVCWRRGWGFWGLCFSFFSFGFLFCLIFGLRGVFFSFLAYI